MTTRACSPRVRLVLAAAILAAIAPAAAAQDPMTPDAIDTAGEMKDGEFMIAPLPVINPTLGNGLALVGGYMYRLDTVNATTPPSLTGLGGFKTDNGSWAASVLQTLHLAQGRLRIRAIGAYADVNYEFFGIGQSAGSAGRSIQLNQAGGLGVVEALVRVARKWYAGARYELMDMTITSGSQPRPDGPTIPAADATLRTAALGPRVEFDSRDSVFYPRSGVQLQGIASFFGEGVGGRRAYQVYQAWFNQYLPLGARNVLAWHVAACDAEGSVAFYDLCLLGKPQDLRGYTIGQYRDHAMVAAQAEWRTEIWWRIGATAFFGGGLVAPQLSALNVSDTLPGGGAGLRFVVADRNHVNLRLDYAWGRNSSALYVGVVEAF